MIRIGKYHLSRNVVLLNVAIWIALIIIISFPFNPSMAVSLILPLIIPVYLHLFFLDKYFNKRKYFWYILFTILIIIVFGVFAEGLANSIGLKTRVQYINEPYNPFEQRYYISTFFINAGFNPLLAIIVSTLFRYFRQRQIFQLQQLKQQKTQAELDLLKNQMNPHFLFNILNTLFSMASMKEDEETANGIAQLSTLMRYMLYETKPEFIRLDKEVDHIKDFIALQKLRFSDDDNKLKVELNITGTTEAYSIPPMLLIPFVENAFKHGFTLKHNTEIKIDLMIYKNQLNFKVFNTIHRKKSFKTEQSGIGIQNVKQRLELLYPGEYNLEINESEHHYETLLKIPVRERKNSNNQ